MYSDEQGDDCLKNFPVEKPIFDANEAPYIVCLPEIQRTFKNKVGYNLRFVRSYKEPDAELSFTSETTGSAEFGSSARRAVFPIGDDSVKIFGNLVLERDPNLTPQLDWEAASELASSLAACLSENYRWRVQLDSCESELAAAGVSIAPSAPYVRSKFSVRLRDVLRVGAKALGGFDAAALYLIDESTTVLSPRALWGLPEERFLEEPRPLSTARAEVEALMGNAVVVNEDYLAEAWNVPEDFVCSVCVPIISETTILGVVWFFANKKFAIGERELETLNLISGKIVDELEKEASAQRAKKQAEPQVRG